MNSKGLAHHQFSPFVLGLILVLLSLSEISVAAVGSGNRANRQTPAFTPSNRTDFYAKIALRNLGDGLSLSDNDRADELWKSGATVEALPVVRRVIQPRSHSTRRRKRGDECVPKVPVVSPSVSSNNAHDAQSSSQTSSSGTSVRLFGPKPWILNWSRGSEKHVLSWMEAVLGLCLFVIIT